MLTPDIETASWGKFALASVTVVGMLSLLAFGLKLLVSRGWIKACSTNSRLQVISALALDSRRRLVLTRCDDKEYLLLLSTNGDILLSSTPLSPSKDKPE